MGKNAVADPPNFKKYGVPFYSVAWIPQTILKSHQKQPTDEVSDAADSSTPSLSPGSGELYLALAGGGGEGRSGIPNSLLIAHFDAASNSLSDQPVHYFFSFLLHYQILMDRFRRCVVIRY